MALDRARDLEDALAQYAHVNGLIDHIRRACGGDDGVSLVGHVLVRAYVIRTTDNVFSVYVLTRDGFVVAEMGIEGDTLAVYIDTLRVARVVEQRTGQVMTVSVEIDGDIRRLSLDGEERGGPTGETEQYMSIHSIRGTFIPARYDISGPVDDRDLLWLARELRRPGG